MWAIKTCHFILDYNSSVFWWIIDTLSNSNAISHSSKVIVKEL